MHHPRLSPFLWFVIVLLTSACFISCSRVADRDSENQINTSSDCEYGLFYELDNAPVFEQKIFVTFDHRYFSQTFRVSRSVDDELKRIQASSAAQETDDPFDINKSKIRGRKNSLDGSSKSPRTVVEVPLLEDEKGNIEQPSQLSYCLRVHYTFLTWLFAFLMSICCKTAVNANPSRHHPFDI